MNEVATEKDNDPIVKFRENIQKKIAEDMGNLMPDDMLAKLVEDSIKGILYKQVPNQNRYGAPKPWIEKLVEEKIEKSLQLAIDKCLEEHTDEIKKAISQTIRTKLPELVASLIFPLLSSNIANANMSLHSALQEHFNR